jgi:hypothetical protein
MFDDRDPVKPEWDPWDPDNQVMVPYVMMFVPAWLLRPGDRFNAPDAIPAWYVLKEPEDIGNREVAVRVRLHGDDVNTTYRFPAARVLCVDRPTRPLRGGST